MPIFLHYEIAQQQGLTQDICLGTDQVNILHFSDYQDKKRHVNPLQYISVCDVAHRGHTITPCVADFDLGTKLSDATNLLVISTPAGSFTSLVSEVTQNTLTAWGELL